MIAEQTPNTQQAFQRDTPRPNADQQYQRKVDREDANRANNTRRALNSFEQLTDALRCDVRVAIQTIRDYRKLDENPDHFKLIAKLEARRRALDKVLNTLMREIQ
jgi:hypothetical protein